MNPELERRLLSCPTLPTLPAVALELLRLCRGEDVDLWRVADALSRDPALAARVLRAANSASIAARGNVSTLTRAVPLLGSNTTLALALSFSLVRGRRRDECAHVDHGEFWRRAVFAALAGRTLAEAGTPAVDGEEAFLGALLQDLGILAYAEVFGGAYGSVWRSAGGDHDRLAALEEAAWGAHHAEASALLLRTWNLPRRLQAAASASHGGAEAARAGRDAFEQRLFACVALSGPLADVWISPGGPEAIGPAFEAAREALGVGAEAVEALVARMALAVPEAAADFDIDLGGQERIEAVLAEARRLPVALRLRGEDAPGEAGGPRVELGDALDGALRLAFDYGRARGEPLAVLVAAADPTSPLARQTLLALARRSLRSTDLVGLDENGHVTALLPATDVAGARAAAQRLVARAAALQAPVRAAVGIGASAPGALASSAASLRASAAAAALAAAPGQVLVGRDADGGGGGAA